MKAGARNVSSKGVHNVNKHFEPAPKTPRTAGITTAGLSEKADTVTTHWKSVEKDVVVKLCMVQ
jgi:hypothetical protein